MGDDFHKGEFKINLTCLNHYCAAVICILFDDLYLYEKRVLSADSESGLLNYNYELISTDHGCVIDDAKDKFDKITRLLKDAIK